MNQPAVPDKSCVRGLPASVLSSEFYAVQVLAGPQNLSTLRNREVSLIRRSSKYTFLWPTVQDPSITEVSLIQRAVIERFHCTACTNVSLILRFSMSTLSLNSWQELGGDEAIQMLLEVGDTGYCITF